MKSYYSYIIIKRIINGTEFGFHPNEYIPRTILDILNGHIRRTWHGHKIINKFREAMVNDQL